MKSIAILSLCAASALATELPLHHRYHNVDFCRSPILGKFPFSTDSVCSTVPLGAQRRELETSSPPLATNESIETTPSLPATWASRTSCIRNSTSEFCVFTSTDFGNGRGLTVLTTPQRAEYFKTLQSFTEPDVLQDANQEVNAHKYQMIHVPGKDVGVVATQPFNKGDHIMTFTPSIMIDYAAYANVKDEYIREMQAEAIDLLPDQLRGVFLNLSTHDGASDHMEKVDKILRTNAFDVNLQDEGEESFYVVFPEISRFNHDCRPNADYYFDPDTLEQHVHAVRPIAVGEEISLTYMDPIKTRNKRLKRAMSIWGFSCGCSLCTQRAEMSAASDDRIRQIITLRKQLQDYSSESAACPSMADLLVSLYEQERLWSSIYEAHALAAKEHNGAGDPWKAIKHARLAIEYGLATVGGKDGDVRDMVDLAEDPWGHWSWLWRTHQRNGWEKMRPKKDVDSEEYEL